VGVSVTEGGEEARHGCRERLQVVEVGELAPGVGVVGVQMASQVKAGSAAGQDGTPAAASSELPQSERESRAGRPRLSQSSRVTRAASAAVRANRRLSAKRWEKARSPPSSDSARRRSSRSAVARES